MKSTLRLTGLTCLGLIVPLVWVLVHFSNRDPFVLGARLLVSFVVGPVAMFSLNRSLKRGASHSLTWTLLVLNGAIVFGFAGLVFLGAIFGRRPAKPAPPRPPEIVNGLGMRFVRVPGGTFTMGHLGDGTSPLRRVSLDSLFIGAHEVTNAQFERFKKHTRGEYSPGDDEPVANVSRAEALAFARWLSKQDGRRYDLPTEAQWEYVARGGLQGKDYSWGDESPDGRALVGGTRCRPVGSFDPNHYGVYDMTGNVAEFVSEAYYSYSALTGRLKNPAGPREGKVFLSRGGGVAVFENKIWQRILEAPEIPQPSTGFRLVIVGTSTSD